MRRRTFLRMTGGALAPAALPRRLAAQAWPSQPVRIIAPSAPGGSLDILSRLFGRGLADRIGQPFVVENRSGGAGNIGFDAVAKSRPDGYTIMIASDPLVTNPLMAAVTYDSVRDFAPIIMIATLSQVLAVHPSVPAATLRNSSRLRRRRPVRSMSAPPG